MVTIEEEALNESYLDVDWSQLQQLFQQAAREVPAEVTQGEVERDVKKMGEAIELGRTLAGERELRDSDKERMVLMLGKELGYTEKELRKSVLREGVEEGIFSWLPMDWQIYLKVLGGAVKSAWLAFVKAVEPSTLGPMVLRRGIVEKGGGWILAVTVLFIIYLGSLASIPVLDYIASIPSRVYRWWKLKVGVKPDSSKVSYEIRQLLPYLAENEVYRFSRDIPHLPATAPMSIKRGLLKAQLPFRFLGFASPRWHEEIYLHIEPVVGPDAGEERLVSLEFVPSIETAEGKPLEDLAQGK